MERVRQVKVERRGGCDGAGVNQPTGGWRHGLAQLPQEDLGAGQQQRRQPHEQKFQQHRATALYPPRLWLGGGGGGVEAVDAQSAQREGGDAQRHSLCGRGLDSV